MPPSHARVLVLLGCFFFLLSPAAGPGLQAGKPGTDEPEYVSVTRAGAGRALDRKQRLALPAEAAGKALSLEDCRSLALERNLALEQAALEAITKKAIARSQSTMMLPHLLFSGELSRRDDFSFGYSDILGRESAGPSITPGGTGVNTWSRGRDLGTWRYSVEARWSPTDAALAYYLSRSARNEEMKERLMRIRIAQKLLGSVEGSFHRLLSLENAGPLLDQLVTKREAVARCTDELFAQQLVEVEDHHRLNEKLIRARGIASSVASERDRQRVLLAAALRISPDDLGTGRLRLSGPLPVPGGEESLPALEQKAVQCRPEAYQAGLDHLSTVNDLKRANIKFYPKLTGFGRYTRDIDRHILFPDWREVGMYVYVDILEWASNLHERKAAKTRTTRTRSEIEAVALGIASQVREAALRYQSGLQEVKTAQQLLASSRKVLETVRRRVDLESQEKMALLESEGDVLQQEIESLRALGEANARLAELRSTVGSNYSEALPRRGDRDWSRAGAAPGAPRAWRRSRATRAGTSTLADRSYRPSFETADSAAMSPFGQPRPGPPAASLERPPCGRRRRRGGELVRPHPPRQKQIPNISRFV
ncbi:MAG: TolC family protein [Candidatus Riflebacteria bacterium]|nr:TolC family protein [Candidatus Riflebacteria bacterium]